VARLRPGSGAARALAWLVRGLDSWGWSPRRHRTGFVAGAAVIAGTAVPVWHRLGGAGTDAAGDAPVAVLTAVAVGVVLTGEITWLGLLRSAPPPR